MGIVVAAAGEWTPSVVSTVFLGLVLLGIRLVPWVMARRNGNGRLRRAPTPVPVCAHHESLLGRLQEGDRRMEIVDEHFVAIEKKLDDGVSERSEIRASLSRIEGYLKGRESSS